MYNPTGNDYAYIGMNLPIPSANIAETGYMLAQRVKYTSVTSIGIVSTANSNLDGTGTLTTLITGANSGTLIRRIIIKAQSSTTQGMIRFFFVANASVWIIREVEVSAINQASTDQSFIAIIEEPFLLSSTRSIKVSTEKAETFIITVEALNMTFP